MLVTCFATAFSTWNCSATQREAQDVLKCNVLIHCSDGWDRTAQVSSARSPRSPRSPNLGWTGTQRYPTGGLKHGVLLKSLHFVWSKLRYVVFLCKNLLHFVAPYGNYMAYMIEILRHGPAMSVGSRWQCFVWIHTTAPCAACCSWSRRTPRRCENVWWCFWILVGGLEHVLYFQYIGNTYPSCLIFFRGVGIPPTRIPVWCLNVHQAIRLKKKPCGRSSVLLAIGFAHDSQMVRSPPASDMAAISAIAASRLPFLLKQLGKKFTRRKVFGFFGSPYAIRELYNTCWWHVIYLECLEDCVCVYYRMPSQLWSLTGVGVCKRILVMGNLKDHIGSRFSDHDPTVWAHWIRQGLSQFFSQKKIEQ